LRRQKAVIAGKITDKDWDEAQRDATVAPITAEFKKLPDIVAVDAFARATPQERMFLEPLLHKKIDNLKTQPPAIRDQFWQEYDKVMRQ
jgi:hypothetical protein